MFKSKNECKRILLLNSEAVAELLRHHSREQKVPGSIPHLGISAEVTS